LQGEYAGSLDIVRQGWYNKGKIRKGGAYEKNAEFLYTVLHLARYHIFYMDACGI
jgi:hypothetical protein